MPKTYAYGNGNTLLLVDQYARLRDLYFPYVGLENHVGGSYAHRIGVWVDGGFSWTDDGTWRFAYSLNESNLGKTVATNTILGVTLTISDVLHHTQNVYLRRFEVRNDGEAERTIKCFFNQQFEIYHSEKGDTAFYDPETTSVIHYEGKRAFLIGAGSGGRAFDEYTVGVFQMEGKEGTFRDAEDGKLEKNSIEHGRVDSTIGVTSMVMPHASATVYYWIAIGNSIDDVKTMHAEINHVTPAHMMEVAGDFWKSWVTRNPIRFYGLGAGIEQLYKQSQFILHSHLDKRGAIIASGDSDMLQYGRDTYSYMWPRDGAYGAVALDWLGDRHGARTFFEFCTSVLSPHGYLMHKYRADRSLGSSWHGWMVNGYPELPIQEDETALVIWALWEHWNVSRDLDFIGDLYPKLIKPAADFLVLYRDEETGLPKQSYNLWEEKFGVHTYTVASVYGALIAASNFALLLGDEEAHERYLGTANIVKDSLMQYLYDQDTGSFLRTLYVDHQGKRSPDKTIDASSAYGVFMFKVLEPNDERLIRAMQITREKLWINTPVGGVARYQGDNYYRNIDDVTGNPWIITTLWFAQYAIACAKTDQDLDEARKMLNWVVATALPTGVLPEQLDPHTKEHISASPLTWSHAEFIRTVILYTRRIDELKLLN